MDMNENENETEYDDDYINQFEKEYYESLNQLNLLKMSRIKSDYNEEELKRIIYYSWPTKEKAELIKWILSLKNNN
jgi:hypothetical protein